MLLDRLPLGSSVEGGHRYATVLAWGCLHTNLILGNIEENVWQGVVSTEGVAKVTGSSSEGGGGGAD